MLTCIILVADDLLLPGGKIDASVYELASYCEHRDLALLAVCQSAGDLKAMEDSHIPRLQLCGPYNGTRPEHYVAGVLRGKGTPIQSVVAIGTTGKAQRLSAALHVPFFSVVRAGAVTPTGIGQLHMLSILRHMYIFYSKSQLWSYVSPLTGEFALLLSIRDLEALGSPLHEEVAAVALDNHHPLTLFFLEHLLSSLVLSGYARRADVWVVATKGDGSEVLEQFARKRGPQFDSEVVLVCPGEAIIAANRFADQKVLVVDYQSDKESRSRMRLHLLGQGAEEVRSVSLFGDGESQNNSTTVATLAGELLVSLSAYMGATENRSATTAAEDVPCNDDDRRATWAEVHGYEPRFGDKYLGWMAREEGTFGSVSLYDDYGDEGDA